MREDRVRKVNRASLLKEANSERDAVRDGGRARKETEASGVRETYQGR